MNEAAPAHDGPSAGFTLIEIIVAFAVATLLLGALYQVFSGALRAGSTADSYARAVLLAESALEVFGVDPVAAPAESTEQLDPKFGRHVIVRPRLDLLNAEAGVPAFILYEIEVHIDWSEGPRARSVSLSTLRVGRRS
jgi:general secretion pathway protein I